MERRQKSKELFAEAIVSKVVEACFWIAYVRLLKISGNSMEHVEFSTWCFQAFFWSPRAWRWVWLLSNLWP